MKKTLTLLLVALVAICLFVGCKEPVSYTVTFDVDGDTTTVPAQTVQEGSKATKPTDPTKTGSYLSAWNKEDGTKFDFNKDTITSNITLKAAWKDSYSIGDEGPAGGWIFYDIDADNASGDKDKLNSYDAGWRYIEAAPDNWNNGTSTGDIQLVWGSAVLGTQISGGTEAGIGKGKSNTANILAETSGTFPAAALCHNYAVSKGTTTYSGWFLPSYDELMALYTNLVKSDSTTKKGTWQTSTGCRYWSSTTTDSSNSAYVIKFDSGSEAQYDRTSSQYVRPVHYV